MDVGFRFFISAPTEGSFAALNGFDGDGTFDYDVPLLGEGELEAGYRERITKALLDEWEPAKEAG